MVRRTNPTFRHRAHAEDAFLPSLQKTPARCHHRAIRRESNLRLRHGSEAEGYPPDVPVCRARAEDALGDGGEALHGLAPLAPEPVAHVAPLAPVEEVEAPVARSHHHLAAPLAKRKGHNGGVKTGAEVRLVVGFDVGGPGRNETERGRSV